METTTEATTEATTIPAQAAVPRDRLSSPKLRPRQEEVVLFQGDDEARINALARDVDDLRERIRLAKRETGATRLMYEQDPVAALAEQLDQRIAEHDALVAEATPRAVRVTIAGIPRKAWRTMISAYPPRDGIETDEKSGLNEEAFAEDAVRACMVAPVFASDADRVEFLDALTDAQFNRLYWTAVGLNRNFGATPKAMLSSPPSPNGGSTTA